MSALLLYLSPFLYLSLFHFPFPLSFLFYRIVLCFSRSSECSGGWEREESQEGRVFCGIPANDGLYFYVYTQLKKQQRAHKSIDKCMCQTNKTG